MSEEAKKEAGQAPKKSSRTIVLVAVAVVLVGGATTAGVFLGPQLLGSAAASPSGEAAKAKPKEKKKAKPEAKDHDEAEAEEEEGEEHAEEHGKEGAEATVVVALAPLVVDTRARDGSLHHLKIGISVELKPPTKAEEFKALEPRGREAALTYLRGLEFESATDPKEFEGVKKELTKRTVKALGKRHVQRVMITDFVAQ